MVIVVGRQEAGEMPGGSIAPSGATISHPPPPPLHLARAIARPVRPHFIARDELGAEPPARGPHSPGRRRDCAPTASERIALSWCPV